MSKLYKMAKSFLKDEDGPTVVEYAVLMALIVIALITVIGTLTTNIETKFTEASDALGGGTGG